MKRSFNQKRLPESTDLAEKKVLNCLLRASIGLSAEFVADESDYSIHQVRYRLHKYQLKISDYRKGNWLSYLMLSKLEEDEKTVKSIEDKIRRTLKQQEREKTQESKVKSTRKEYSLKV